LENFLEVEEMDEKSTKLRPAVFVDKKKVGLCRDFSSRSKKTNLL